MDKIWKYAFLFFCLIGFLFHNEKEMVEGLLNCPNDVLNLFKTIILSGALWGGLFHIVEMSGFMNYFAFLFKPLLRFLYGQIVNDQYLYSSLSTNFVANLLGLGTLATMSGLKAFQQLGQYNQNKERPSKEMMQLVVCNSAGFCLFPSSVIMLRKQFNSVSLYTFYPYIFIIGIILFIVGVALIKVIVHE